MKIDHASTFSFNREFYSVDFNQAGEPELHSRILNIFQRVLRFLFGAYSDTIWNQKKSTELSKKFPDAWKAIENQIVDDDLFEKVFKIARQPLTLNIVVLGGLNSGKTTLVEVLKDICHLPKKNHETPAEVNTLKLGKYTFRFLEISTYTNDDVLEVIRTKAEEIFQGNGFKNIDSVISTISYHHGLPHSYLNVIYDILDGLPPEIKKIHVVTNTERLREDFEIEYINECNKQREMIMLMQNHLKNENNIFFSGSLEETDCTNQSKKFIIPYQKYIYANTQEIIKVLLPDTLTNEEKNEILEIRSDELAKKVDAFLTGLGMKKEPQNDV